MPWMIKKEEFQYLAQNYYQPPLIRPINEQLDQIIKEACSHNATVAKQANQYGASKNWTLLEHRVGKEPGCGAKLMKMPDKDGYDDGGYEEDPSSNSHTLSYIYHVY